MNISGQSNSVVSNYFYRDVELICSVGDILHCSLDAICVSCDSNYSLSAGVGALVRRAGGNVFLHNISSTPRNGSVIAIPSAGCGLLRSSFVILVPLRRSHRFCMNLVYSSIFECAKANNIQTMAVPALGTGIYGLSAYDAANHMKLALESISSFAPIQRIHFIDLSLGSLDVFRNVLNGLIVNTSPNRALETLVLNYNNATEHDDMDNTTPCTSTSANATSVAVSNNAQLPSTSAAALAVPADSSTANDHKSDVSTGVQLPQQTLASCLLALMNNSVPTTSQVDSFVTNLPAAAAGLNVSSANLPPASPLSTQYSGPSPTAQAANNANNSASSSPAASPIRRGVGAPLRRWINTPPRPPVRTNFAQWSTHANRDNNNNTNAANRSGPGPSSSVHRTHRGGVSRRHVHRRSGNSHRQSGTTSSHRRPNKPYSFRLNSRARRHMYRAPTARTRIFSSSSSSESGSASSHRQSSGESDFEDGERMSTSSASSQSSNETESSSSNSEVSIRSPYSESSASSMSSFIDDDVDDDQWSDDTYNPSQQDGPSQQDATPDDFDDDADDDLDSDNELEEEDITENNMDASTLHDVDDHDIESIFDDHDYWLTNMLTDDENDDDDVSLSDHTNRANNDNVVLTDRDFEEYSVDDSDDGSLTMAADLFNFPIPLNELDVIDQFAHQNIGGILDDFVDDEISDEDIAAAINALGNDVNGRHGGNPAGNAVLNDQPSTSRDAAATNADESIYNNGLWMSVGAAELRAIRESYLQDEQRRPAANENNCSQDEVAMPCAICLCELLVTDIATPARPHRRTDSGTAGVVASRNSEGVVRLNVCKHLFHERCIKMAFDVKHQCPLCMTWSAPAEGNQPLGAQMQSRVVRGRVPGHPDANGFHEIRYTIPSGIQTDQHPRPGVPFYGTTRTAYLPNNAEGTVTLRLLELAFQRRLIFTIGDSITSGRQNVVVWNGIHHKTSKRGGPQNFGYPDAGYLDRVQEELEQIGIRKELLNNH